MKQLRWLCCALAMAATAAAAQPVDVTVRTEGERVIIDVKAQAAASPKVAWAVLTDFDRMPRFLSAVKTSSVRKRAGNRLEVAQTGEVSRGFMHFGFSTVRSVELVGEREIRTQLVEGSFKAYDTSTKLLGDAADAVTIVYHGDYVPTSWVPPGIGPSMIESETRNQYLELIAEMLRRQAAAGPSPQPPPNKQ